MISGRAPEFHFAPLPSASVGGTTDNACPGITCGGEEFPAVFPSRFLQKIRVLPGGCWAWIGARDPGGYGSVKWQRRVLNIHRVVYELIWGTIPAGFTVDHICHRRSCLRPDHLRLLTLRENMLAGHTASAHRVRQTLCPSGHVFENASRGDHRGQRCRFCNQEYGKSRYWTGIRHS